MYCKNCKHPVTAQDQYCPNCSETLTEYTVANSFEELDETKQNVAGPQQEKKISKDGRTLITIGIILLVLQIMAYLGNRGRDMRINLDTASGIGSLIGYNFLLILGLVFIFQGMSKKEK